MTDGSPGGLAVAAAVKLQSRRRMLPTIAPEGLEEARVATTSLTTAGIGEEEEGVRLGIEDGALRATGRGIKMIGEVVVAEAAQV